jgi:hypothetical protein
MAPSLGTVIEFPARRVASATSAASGAASGVIAGASSATGSFLRALGFGGAGSVDDWGRDPELVSAVIELSRLRWDIATGGFERMPRKAGALVVTNARRYALAPIFTAFALTRALDRPVRFVGRPDDAPVGPFARRIGGLLDRPEEVRGALRAGELVVMGAAPHTGTRAVGIINHHLVGAAVATKVGVYPAATTSSPFGRQARVEIGRRLQPPRHRRGPLAELELADRVRREIERLLDEMGDISTGTTLDWLPFMGLGSH